ncbi:hypothetical protein SAMN05660772_01865 [Pasteurella testudinis DSM 23072]|uniref:Uncharacterized protein n=1 Tax=Pasteurella testudinis DSM 23072 TaxID=1122938 RepID=A0A1W1UKC8_9PAST|nr:hypothetical protein [Pasteurella testudinis]SMB81473.1 hypothetical protein SAMN05660772_01865 [Pasteurella testudinis DSM 23072]SUB51423.1 Uncharacterised protein [Pasteurella testudinis]
MTKPNKSNYLYQVRPHPKYGWLVEVYSYKTKRWIARKHVANEELAEAARRRFVEMYDGELAAVIRNSDDSSLQWGKISDARKKKLRERTVL